MPRKHPDRPEAAAHPSSLAIVTQHGEGETHWHVVDRSAPGCDQPAVLRTFSSRNSIRDDARSFLEAQGIGQWGDGS